MNSQLRVMDPVYRPDPDRQLPKPIGFELNIQTRSEPSESEASELEPLRTDDEVSIRGELISVNLPRRKASPLSRNGLVSVNLPKNDHLTGSQEIKNKHIVILPKSDGHKTSKKTLKLYKQENKINSNDQQSKVESSENVWIEVGTRRRRSENRTTRGNNHFGRRVSTVDIPKRVPCIRQSTLFSRNGGSNSDKTKRKLLRKQKRRKQRYKKTFKSTDL